jgi:FkbH-like protein
MFTLQVRMADKFGDLGMIGIVIGRPLTDDASAWDIDTWLMSCRVLGREVEQAMLTKVVTEAKRRGIERLIGTYIATAKNSMVAEHYRKLGFEQVASENGGQTVWRMNVSEYAAPALTMRVEDKAMAPPEAAE